MAPSRKEVGRKDGEDATPLDLDMQVLSLAAAALRLPRKVEATRMLGGDRAVRSDPDPELMEFRESELGRLLAAAHGYQVLSAEGRSLGVIEHLRYAHHADHPDELVVRLRNRLWRRRRCLSFSAVRTVDPDLQHVVLRLSAEQANASPQA